MNVEGVNWAKIVRDLVIECGMAYSEVMELTPEQILILATEKSDPPDRLSFGTVGEIREIVDKWRDANENR